VSPAPEFSRVLTGLPRLTRDLAGEDEGRPILVSGPPSVTLELQQLLAADGEIELVRRVSILDLEDPELAGSPVLLYVIRGQATPTDERALRRADRHAIPIVCLRLGEPEGEGLLPYVRATDVVRAATLGPEARDAVARRIGARAPAAAPGLARGLPALRSGVGEAVIEEGARRTAVLAAMSSRFPGPDLPALALVEIRMGLRLAVAQGRDPRKFQVAAAAGALAGGFALRALNKGLADRLPLPAFAVRSAVAYAGARALGEVGLRLGRRVRNGSVRAR
jgi:hypothetical protein